MNVADLLEPGDIHLHFDAASIAEAIPRLLEPALLREFHDPAIAKTIVDSAVRREEESSTRCGGTVALPHARSSAVDKFVVTLGVRDIDPRLIFAFVSPEGQREQHLKLLASLARLSQNSKVVEQITSASKVDQVIDALRSAGI